MKILNRLKTDAKIIIRDLHNANDSLIDTVIEYQQIIFDQKETIIMLEEEIERLQPYEQLYKDLKAEHLETIKAIKQAESEAVKEFADELFTKFSGHSDYHGDTILCQIICMAEGKTTDVAKPLDTSTIKSKAIREFAERLKEMSEHFELEKENFVSEETVDNLVKEMVGDSDE